MPKFTPGHKKLGGRPKGGANKTTQTAREAIALLVETNAPRMMEWLEEIRAKDGPKVAYTCLLDLMEYHIPKLSRAEVTGKDGADLMPKIITYKVEP